VRKNAAKRAAYQADPEAGARKLREWRAANPERQKEIERKYRDGHKPEQKQRHAAWRAKNREHALQRKKEWHAAHRETQNAKRIAHYHAHKQESRKMSAKARQTARIITPWIALLHSAKCRAKDRDIPFSLTKEWAQERWTGRCEVSGLSFSLGGRDCGPKVYSPSIDQIEAKKGYTPDNCRFVIWAVNALKHDGTDDDMYLIAAAILENRGLKRAAPKSITPSTT
jgi:hypothetical protein